MSDPNEMQIPFSKSFSLPDTVLESKYIFPEEHIFTVNPSFPDPWRGLDEQSIIYL